MFCDQVRFSMHARCASISSGKHEQVSHRAKKNFLIHARMKQYTKPRALENKSCNYHCCLCLGLGESNQIPWGHFFAELSFSTAGLVNRQPARGCCWNAGSGWWHMAWPELSGWSCCSWFWWWSQCCCKWLHQKAWLQFYLPAPALAAAHLWNETNHWCTGSLKGPRFKLRNKRAILHVCIQLRQVHEPTKGRWCTTIAKLSAAVTGLPLVLHVSLPKTIFPPRPPPIPSTVKVKFGILLYWRMFSIVHSMSEPMKLSGLQGHDERIYKSQREPAQQICRKTLKVIF